MDALTRRQFMMGVGISSVGIIMDGCAKDEKSKEVAAVEDLMREHAVLRRALFVYSEVAARLLSEPSSLSPDAVQRTATLFRSFGEEYHEKKLEEAYIFPAVKKAGSEAAQYPDILVAQHRRGRDITEYIITLTRRATLDAHDAKLLALALESIVRMYRPHAAREDAVVFPAWKLLLTAKQLDEMSDRFEDIYLTNANLTDANLHDANLSKANVSGAKFTNANLYNAIWADGKRCKMDSRGPASREISPWPTKRRRLCLYPCLCFCSCRGHRTGRGLV